MKFKQLTGADLNSLEFSVIPDHDWRHEWKRHARPMRFGSRLRVWPSAPPEQATGSVTVDRDDQTLQAARANGYRNACNDGLEVLALPDLPANEQYDVLLANILSGTLIDFAPNFSKVTALGANVVLSGIPHHQIKGVRLAYANWIKLSVKNEQDGCILLTGKRAH